MDVAVKAASRQDLTLARNRLGPRTDDDVHTRLRIWVARLADLGNAPVFQAHVSLINTAVIHDQRVGDHRIHSPTRAAGLCLSHPVADHLAAAEFDLFAVDRRIGPRPTSLGRADRLGGQITLDLDDQIGVSQTDAVAGGGAEHGSIISTGNLGGHKVSLTVRGRF